MGWSKIKYISKLYIKIALLSVSFIPFIVDILRKINLTGFLNDAIKMNKIVLIGSIGYLIGCLIAQIKIPEVIKKYNYREEFQEWCKQNHRQIVPTRDFPEIKKYSVDIIRKKFPKFKHYFPVEKSIELASSEEICFIYACVSFELQNQSMRTLRWFLTVFFLISIFLIILPQIIRIFSAIGW